MWKLKRMVVNKEKWRKFSHDDLSRISPKKVRILLELLKYKTWDEIKDAKIIPIRTIYRYKTFIECFGLTGVVNFGDHTLKEKNFLKYHYYLAENIADLPNLRRYGFL